MRLVLAIHHIIRLIVNASVRQDVRVIITTCVNIVRQLTLCCICWYDLLQEVDLCGADTLI